jgi:hypothetical protein
MLRHGLRVLSPIALTVFPLLISRISGYNLRCHIHNTGWVFSRSSVSNQRSTYIITHSCSFERFIGISSGRINRQLKMALGGVEVTQNPVAKTQPLTTHDWIPLCVSPSELRCDATLVCGQSFRWRKTADDEWSGVISGKLVSHL